MSDVINLYMIVHSLTIVRLLTLDRLALWHKLLHNCVDGKMFIKLFTICMIMLNPV